MYNIGDIIGVKYVRGWNTTFKIISKTKTTSPIETLYTIQSIKLKHKVEDISEDTLNEQFYLVKSNKD
jgi:hypothetical protein